MVIQSSIDNFIDIIRTFRRQTHLHACTPSLQSYVRQCGMEAHTSLGNLLVSVLAECGRMYSAESVFNMLGNRTNDSCNALIHGYFKCGELRRALIWYQKLQQHSFHLSKYTCVDLVKACTILDDASSGCKIHAQIGSLAKDRFVGTSLIDMYAKCGILEKAQDVFDNLLDHDVVAWNALIAGYAQQDHAAEALDCFEKMRARGVTPDAITFACTLKACGSISDADKGEEIHTEIRKRGLLGSNIIIGNALVDMYSKCGLLDKAQEIFDKLPNRNVVSWTALLGGYAQQERGMEALKCFSRMLHQGVPPDALTFACVLKACGSIKGIEKGLDVHSDIERRGLFMGNVVVGNALVDMYAKCGFLAKAQEVFDRLPVCDVVSWTALLGGYGQHEQFDEALECFKQMQLEGVPPNMVTFANILNACGGAGALERGIMLHYDIEEQGLIKDSQLVGNTLVDMYAKCGVIERAHSVFDNLLVRDVVSWTVLLTGYAQLGEVTRVFCLFERMCEEGVKPNSITFISILNACSHAGLVDEGHILFAFMGKDYDITPTVQHDTCIVDLLARAGQLERAIATMKHLLSYPHIAFWLTILGACRKWGDVDLGCYAFKQAVALDEKETTAYVSMCNIYAYAGMREDARRVEQMSARVTGLELAEELLVE